MTGVSDSFHRPINYLRISVTDRCNLRCVYCMPSEGVALLNHRDILSYEEIALVASAAVEMGIQKIRVTGGEPLVRAGLPILIRKLANIRGINDLSLTTNGILLPRQARELKDAGLSRVNISLDSVRPERFRQITRTGRLENVFQGIEEAEVAGLNPVKINMVVMRGINDDEVIEFAHKTVEDGWHVRFIEFMPLAEGRRQAEERFVPNVEIIERIAPLGVLTPHTLNGNGPAKYFHLPQATGTIGFISPVSEHFCFKCNRLRLTADGRLLPCLLSDDEIDLRGPLRSGASIDGIKGLLKQAIDAKPQGHKLKAGATRENRQMSQIGG